MPQYFDRLRHASCEYDSPSKYNKVHGDPFKIQTSFKTENARLGLIEFIEQL